MSDPFRESGLGGRHRERRGRRRFVSETGRRPSTALFCAFRGVRAAAPAPRTIKKAGVAERPEAFGHAGLLVDGPPGWTGVPLT